MKNSKKKAALLASVVIGIVSTFISLPSSIAQENIDISYLQTCLKTDGASLDVLVLMDSSKSLRDWKPEDGGGRKNKRGSDPKGIRGPILKSSLKLLRDLAGDSGRDFSMSLRNFGNNSDSKELNSLQSKWIDWTSDASDSSISKFVENALYEDSSGTQWASGIASAKTEFESRFNQAQLSGHKSCPIMFWITDGAPSDSTAPICADSGPASINWFRENHVLVLGGLLQPLESPEREKSEEFGPLVEGISCGHVRPGWTKGTVIKADDISALAWRFVGLIANIKNLVNLNATGSSFNADPSTSQFNIYIKGTGKPWEIHAPDGSIFCSSNEKSSRCTYTSDPDIGITTVTVFPTDPRDSGGKWTVTPSLSDDQLLVYGSLNTVNKPTPDTRIRLVVKPVISGDAEEGKSYKLSAALQYSDGKPFNPAGYSSIRICASVASKSTPNCSESGATAQLEVFPVLSDKSVDVEAVLISAIDSSREYRLSESLPISVSMNANYPSLSCDSSGEICHLKDLANKESKTFTVLTVKASENGQPGGKIYLSSFKILADEVKARGDGHFEFIIKKSSGEDIAWNNENQLLSPGDELKLYVGTSMAGKGKVQGVINYVVIGDDGKVVERQLQFDFHVGNAISWMIILFMLLAYLLTAGIPYAFLLWQAKKNAVLLVPDGEYSFLVLPFEINDEGKLRQTGLSDSSAIFAPDYKQLQKQKIGADSKTVQIDRAHIEVIPPKWNPFKKSSTEISIPGAFLVTTYGHPGITFEKSSFSPSLVDEVVLYFDAEGNINASRTVKEEVEVSDSGLDFLESEYETHLSDVTAAPEGSVSGTAIFITQAYGSRKQSIKDAVAKVTAIVTGIDWKLEIEALREKSLKDALARQAEEKAIAEANNKGREVSKEHQNDPVVQATSEEDEWGGSSSSSSGNQNSSSSSSDEEW